MAQHQSVAEELYRAAVGENKAEYYLPLFSRFDAAGSRASWNWPAFFVTFFWMLYRRMYGPALAYLLLWPLVLVLFGAISMLLLGEATGALMYWVVGLGVPYVAIPLFANAIYHWHVKNRIDKLSASTLPQEALVQRLIGQGATAGSAAIVGIACFAGVALVGILAAIAIPAYQDYTIRAQVTEGLNLAGPVKISVTDAYAASGAWPADLGVLGRNAAPHRGKYVSSIEVNDGTVLIRYGNAAHGSIAGHTLSLRPASLSNDQIQWSCGYAGDDSDHAVETDIPPKYLPMSCRATR